MIKRLLIPILILLSITALEAKTINYCEAPMKPAAFSNKAEVKLYDESAKIYENCIKKFIKNTNEEIQEKTEVLNKTIEEWNKFVSEQ